MRDIADVSEGIRKEELFKVTATVFGFKKMSENIESRLNLALMDAVQTRRVIDEQNGFVKAL
jgi:hypothetical protein